MDREFLDHYNRELQLLKEHGAEFAEDFPGIAGRLGGLLGERSDPMIMGLLEGAAFLAARVQLKLKHEFPEFCSNLLEQLVPHYQAPTPSIALVAATPQFGEPALLDGRTFTAGSLLDAEYRQLDRLINCRFRLTSDIVLWPFDIPSAQYFDAPGALQALGVPVSSNVQSGLRIALRRRATAKESDEKDDLATTFDPELQIAKCKADSLKFYLVGPEADAVGLYEQIHAHTVNVAIRYLDRFGDPVVIQAPPNCISQIGFDEHLLPADDRIFSGFDLLRDYFTFPRKFLGFRISGLRKLFARIPSRKADLVLSFDQSNARLPAATNRDMFALYSAPAINLFDKVLDRIPVKRNQHEYQIIPDRSHMLDFEPHRLVEVFAHFSGGYGRVPVAPLYSASSDGLSEPDLFYTVRRLPRRRSNEERRYGTPVNYVGTELFLTLVEPGGLDEERPVAELSIRALCTNRHLTEHMRSSATTWRLIEASETEVKCLAGPSPPRGPVAAPVRSRYENANLGTIAWRLINMLSLNHLGLVERGAGGNAQALRETLALFADISEPSVERRIRGVRSVDSRPIVRRMRSSAGVGAARGVEIVVLLDEQAFEGTGAFLLGAVLERFYAEYASVNHFTQTVIRTIERGEIMRWPARAGARRLA